MDESHHDGEPGYDPNYRVPALSPSSTLAGLSSTTPANSNHDFDPTFSYGLPTFVNLPPSSLNMFHTSHDDSCIDTCITRDHNPQAPWHRGSNTSSHSHRASLSTLSLPRPHYPLEDGAYTQPFLDLDAFSPDFFPDMKSPMDNVSKSNDHFSYMNHQVDGHHGIMGPGMYQCPVPDDCVSVDCSQFSCLSNCCSRVCDDKTCAETTKCDEICRDGSCTEGTPCDDTSCFDGPQHPIDNFFNFPEWHHPIPQGLTDESHNQPCSHTNAEHDVAFTLRDLRAPGPSNAPHPQGDFQFGCPFLGTSEQPADAGGAFPLGHNQSVPVYGPTTDTSPSKSRTGPKVLAAPAGATQHVCNWIVCSDDAALGEEVCGRVFDDSSSLNDHLCNEHINLLSAKTKYVCLWKGCSRRDDQEFASRNKLKRHITTHSSYKPFLCEQCGEGFSAQQALDQHLRTHTGEKPYKCTEPGCGKSFKQKSALTMHIRTHTGEKPLKCEICGKCFCESSNLSKHRKTHNPDYKFKCDEPGCDSQFIRIDQLKRHQAKHTRARQKKRTRARSQAGLLTPSDELTSFDGTPYPLTVEGEFV